MSSLNLFDGAWYLATNPDVAAAVERGELTASQHYQQFGAAEGRSPSPFFDPDYYLAQNHDLLENAEENIGVLLEHFEQTGMQKGISPFPLFDEAYYLEQNPDAAELVQNGEMTAIEHFLTVGLEQGLAFNPQLPMDEYLANNPDVAAAVDAGTVTALEHLMSWGLNEGRQLFNGVDAESYASLSGYSEALGLGDHVSALEHVLNSTNSSLSDSTAIYAPYIDLSLWVNPPLATISQASGIQNFTLAFILSSGQNKIGWGGQTDISQNDLLPNGQNILDQINDLRAAGGDVMISFGGAFGTPPAGAVDDAATLQSLYQMVIDRYSVTSLDFDVEGQWVTDQASISLRNEALLALDEANENLEISFTLPVLPTGLDPHSLALLQSAHDAGVDIDLVNVMAMDYGSAVDQGGQMGKCAIDAIQNTSKQLDAMGLDAKVGVTPMIGVNDIPTEIFTLEHAQQVADYIATDSNVGRVGIWSVTRDNGDGAGQSQASATYSGIEQDLYEFSHILGNMNPAAVAADGESVLSAGPVVLDYGAEWLGA